MSEHMDVSPELLLASGSLADSHSQGVFTALTAADAAIETALESWVGQSRSALTARAARWADATTAFTTRLYEHGEGLRISGLTFSDLDRGGA